MLYGGVVMALADALGAAGTLPNLPEGAADDAAPPRPELPANMLGRLRPAQPAGARNRIVPPIAGGSGAAAPLAILR